ncbi:adenylate/guanylate cyclase domain-containing protein [Nocardioides insulae]|uniref:adenylate/guanylate cyclase domain-containing protein n=1 Tax=Nocardioides insulae TaxID=394734 RepID=UPI00048A9884|nr:adenylate/guanylate cyclase domain-containing protein [Nocardioides insulae]
MTCSACGATISRSARFCSSCGAALALDGGAPDVPRDGWTTSPGDASRRLAAAYTPRHLTDEVLTSPFALEGERKQVTVLFADLIGSTELASRVGADAMHTVLDSLFEAAARAVHRYEGTINQFLGDGFMALFGAPIAHEDHARRGVHAALDLQEELRRADIRAGGIHLTDLPVRIGLNTGVVVVGAIGDGRRMDYTAIGDTTNLAARVMSLSGAGQVLATDTTARLAGPAFRWSDQGSRQVKGIKEPVSVRLAAGRTVSATTPRADTFAQTRFVGRAAELDLLTRRCAALGSGTGGLVSLVGEPGLGKTRLLGELLGRVATPGSAGLAPLWLEGRSLSFGESLGYWPFQDMLRRWLGVSEGDAADDVTLRLREAVTDVAPERAAQIVPYLLILLGLPVPDDLDDRVRYLDNQGSGAAVFRAVRELVDRLAAKGPVVLVFEDLHWADPASVELLKHLMPLVRTRPVLVLGVARPEQHSPVASLRSLALEQFSDCFTEVRLRPLSDHDGLELLDGLLTGDGQHALRQRIVERAEGNPFYAEEMVRALAAEGSLVRDHGARAWRLHADPREIAIPDSVQAAISARIDRLDDEVKRVLKVAAVIGRTFLYRILEALADPDADLADDVRHLTLVELIRERRNDPELEFAFTHALVQEATYDSVLLEARRRLHRQVAESVEKMFHDRLDEFAGILAYHYAAAERWDKAQEHLLRAADNASRVAADSVALAQYQQAIEAYGRAFGDRWDPLERARLERKVADALFRMGQHGRAIEHAQEASRLLGTSYPSTRGGLRRAIVRQALVQLWHVLRPQAWRRKRDEHTAAVLTERCALADLLGWMDFFLDPERFVLDVLLSLNNAERSGARADIVNGAVGVAIVLYTVGLTRWGASYVRRATRIAEGLDDPRSIAYALLGEAHRASYEGLITKANSVTERGAQAYRRIGDIRKENACSAMGIQFARMTGDIRLAQERGKHVYSDGLNSNDSMLVAWGGQNLGFIGSSLGTIDEARAYLEDSLATYLTIPSWNSVSEVLADLAVCDRREGLLDEALARLDEADGYIKEYGLRGYSVAYPVLRRAQAWLCKVETSEDAQRRQAVMTAKAAVKDARRLAKTVPLARAWARQLEGTAAWLTGEEGKALKAWNAALAAATELEAPYAAALALLDRGRFTGSAGDLQRAARIFDDCLMRMDADDARAALASLDSSEEAA